MPVIGITTGVSGWYVAKHNGFAATHSALFPWVVAAGVVTLLLTVLGRGVLLPTNVRTLRELRNPQPDHELMRRWTFRTRRLAWVQGVLQLTVLVVMVYLAIAP